MEHFEELAQDPGVDAALEEFLDSLEFDEMEHDGNGTDGEQMDKSLDRNEGKPKAPVAPLASLKEDKAQGTSQNLVGESLAGTKIGKMGAPRPRPRPYDVPLARKCKKYELNPNTVPENQRRSVRNAIHCKAWRLKQKNKMKTPICLNLCKTTSEEKQEFKARETNLNN